LPNKSFFLNKVFHHTFLLQNNEENLLALLFLLLATSKKATFYFGFLLFYLRMKLDGAAIRPQVHAVE
jgi:hypothetical protein